MLTWIRYERNNDDEWPIRPDGLPGGDFPAGCCILRLDDPGDGSSDILRLDDPGDGSSCIQPLSCNPVIIPPCCILRLLADPGPTDILRLDDVDGTSCIEPLNCTPAAEPFNLLDGAGLDLLDGDTFDLLS